MPPWRPAVPHQPTTTSGIGSISMRIECCQSKWIEPGLAVTQACIMTKPNPFRHFKTLPQFIRLFGMMRMCFPWSLPNVEDLLQERVIDICRRTAPRFGDALLGNFGCKKAAMSGAEFTDEFKHDAVAQVEDRGYPVRDVAERLGISAKSIYTWQKLFSRPGKVINAEDAQADEIRRLERDLARVTEERDIQKKATAYFARECR